ncbi:MAG: helix-turn-helix domain-containing protein [Parabacteroides sp.]|nr:helix-turn-helix domain-containing protein [Parabacteroides sp.]
MAECYLEKDDQGAAYAILDSIHMNPDSVDENSCYYYSLLNRYYARRGDALKARCYLDSMMTAFRRYEDKYNTLIILRAEQELFESEQARKQMQINTFQHMLFFMGITDGIILIALIIISILYRKKHQAYRKLAARSREWAEREPTVMLITEVDDADIALMEGIALLFEEERIYLDPAFDLESLSQRLGVHRNLISKAINTVYGKSFSSFINECRVRQAILLLSDPANDSLSLEAIAFDAGFSTRQTFYRVFKAQTGINPATYRKNREAQVDTY